MISKFHFFAAALAGVLICSVAGAQVRNGTSSVRGSSPHARPATRASANSMPSVGVGFRSGRQTNFIQFSPSGGIASGFAPSTNSFRFDRFLGVPGLGFDYPHLAAIGGALRNNSSHFGRDGFQGQNSFAPIFFGGYPYYPEDLGYDQQDQPDQQQDQQPDQQAVQQPQPQPQPQIIVIQQPAPAPQAADYSNGAANAPASDSDLQAAPIPDAGDFILVRRDGRILFASVFSIVGGQLQYVTREGIRHTLAMSDLDADATQQMNEARGTTVQIHN